MNIITFVLGRNHHSATLYIRRKVREGVLANRFRNITNPNTVKSLRSTENTTIEFVFLDGAQFNKRYAEFRTELQYRQTAEAGIVERKDS